MQTKNEHTQRLDPLIIGRLSKATEPEEVIDIWVDHRVELRDALFILSHPKTGGDLRWPAKMDWGEQGFLRSIFAHSKLWFLSSDILQAMGEGDGRVDFPLDYTIGFDVNAASNLRAFVEGSSSEIIFVVQETLRTLAGRRFNWEMMPFFAERSADLASGTEQARDGIWRAIVATERFGACDQRHFADTGQIRPTVDESEIISRAQMQIALWDQMQKEGFGRIVREQHRLLYMMVLKIALLEHANPGPLSAGNKVGSFIRFLDEDVSSMWLNVLWAAGMYFSQGGKFRPFAKLGTQRERLLKTAANVAWDLYHITFRREYVAPTGRNGAFHIPYFLTFDSGLAELLDGCPQRSCLIQAGSSFPQFFTDINFQSWLLKSWPSLAPQVAQCFSIEGAQRRAARIKNRRPGNDEAIIIELEREARSRT